MCRVKKKKKLIILNKVYIISKSFPASFVVGPKSSTVDRFTNLTTSLASDDSVRRAVVNNNSLDMLELEKRLLFLYLYDFLRRILKGIYIYIYVYCKNILSIKNINVGLYVQKQENKNKTKN